MKRLFNGFRRRKVEKERADKFPVELIGPSIDIADKILSSSAVLNVCKSVAKVVIAGAAAWFGTSTVSTTPLPVAPPPNTAEASRHTGRGANPPDSLRTVPDH